MSSLSVPTNEVKITPYIPAKHYAIISAWWTAHKWPVIPADYLPSVGFVAENLCAGFLYRTDSAFAWVEFVVSNPASDKMDRSHALDSLLGALVNKARELGFKAIHTSVTHPSLITRYKQQGFVIADSGMTNLVLPLNQ